MKEIGSFENGGVRFNFFSRSDLTDLFDVYRLCFQLTQRFDAYRLNLIKPLKEVKIILVNTNVKESEAILKKADSIFGYVRTALFFKKSVVYLKIDSMVSELRNVRLDEAGNLQKLSRIMQPVFIHELTHLVDCPRRISRNRKKSKLAEFAAVGNATRNKIVGGKPLVERLKLLGLSEGDYAHILRFMVDDLFDGPKDILESRRYIRDEMIAHYSEHFYEPFTVDEARKFHESKYAKLKSFVNILNARIEQVDAYSIVSASLFRFIRKAELSSKDMKEFKELWSAMKNLVYEFGAKDNDYFDLYNLLETVHYGYNTEIAKTIILGGAVSFETLFDCSIDDFFKYYEAACSKLGLTPLIADTGSILAYNDVLEKTLEVINLFIAEFEKE